MNKDIQTLIEREANTYAVSNIDTPKSLFTHLSKQTQNDIFDTVDSSFQAGASFALSLFKWRKVSEGLPEVEQEAYPVLVYRKYKKEEYKMDTLWIIPDMSVGDSFKFYGVAEWMPIPQID